MTTLITRIKIKIRSIEHNVIHTVDCSRFSFFLILFHFISVILSFLQQFGPINPFASSTILDMHSKCECHKENSKSLILIAIETKWTWSIPFCVYVKKKKRILFELNWILCCPFIFRAFDRSFELIRKVKAFTFAALASECSFGHFKHLHWL